MSRLAGELRELIGRRRAYFRNDEQKIAEENLSILKNASLVTVFLLILFLILTPYILEGWNASLQHIIFVPISCIFLIIAVFSEKRRNTEKRKVMVMCCLFNAMLLTFILLIDVFSDPSAPSTFMPVICVTLPMLFIIPIGTSLFQVFGFGAVYIFLVDRYKDAEIAYYDILNVLVALSFSAAIANFTMSLRMRDFELQVKYKRISMGDELSGLYNKHACISQIREYIDENHTAVCGTMVIIDLDDFKRINDVYGHYTGAIILNCMGRALQSAFRSSDIAGRFGGDEFLLFAAGLSSEKIVRKKCRLVAELLKKLVSEELRDEEMDVSCSIGAVIVRNENTDYDSLFRRADRALYDAKNSGKNRAVIYLGAEKDSEQDGREGRKIRLD